MLRRPSLVLSLLSAMFTADASPASAAAPTSGNTQAPPTLSTPMAALSEDQKIVADARRSLGSELSDL